MSEPAEDRWPPPKLRVMQEWSSDGIWQMERHESTAVGPMISLDDLDISESLRNRFRAWQDRFDQSSPGRPDTFPPHETFDAEKLNLTISLSAELGDASEVNCEIEDRVIVFRAGACIAVLAREPTPPWNPPAPTSIAPE